MFATSSKDESIVIWQTDTVLAQGRSTSDPVLCVLKEHEHVIDCIAWAPLECARTIELAEYSGGEHS